MIAVYPQRKMLPHLGSAEHSPEPTQPSAFTALPPFVTRGSGHAPSAGLPACIHSPGCPSLSVFLHPPETRESLRSLCSVRRPPCEPTVLTTCLPVHSSALAFRQEEVCISLLTQDVQGRFPHWNVPQCSSPPLHPACHDWPYIPIIHFTSPP